MLSVACCDLWGHAVWDGGALVPTGEQMDLIDVAEMTCVEVSCQQEETVHCPDRCCSATMYL